MSDDSSANENRDRINLLQIVHISDLHIRVGQSDVSRLANKQRAVRMFLRNLLENYDIGGWNEGMPSHDETAGAAFEEFLDEFTSDPNTRETWFSGAPAGPETWLIDTGDATTFGDEPSLSAAQQRLTAWKQKLGAHKALSLFGNHDAWPGKQPFLEAGPDYSAQMKLQESMLRDWESWRRERWIDPLATTNVPERPRIECYGLNTVSFSFWNNVKAIGEIDETELNDLRCRMAMRDDGNVLRILATHHPIVFPYKLNEVKGGLGRQNNLKDAKRIAALLRNEKRAPPYSGISAFAHLMLAGHTHYGMPGSALPRNVRESYQQGLGSNQLQLVTGGLMLVKDRNAARKAHEGVTNEVENRSNDLYSQATVFKASQQFQILRFSCSPKAPWRGVEMTRHVMARSHSAGGKYRQYSPLKSETFFPLGA